MDANTINYGDFTSGNLKPWKIGTTDVAHTWEDFAECITLKSCAATSEGDDSTPFTCSDGDEDADDGMTSSEASFTENEIMGYLSPLRNAFRNVYDLLRE